MTNYTDYEIIKKKTGKAMSVTKFAIERFKKGEHIVYSDIECVATDGKDYYVLDECGHYIWVNPDEYEVKKK